MRSLWDELHSSYVGPVCTCGALGKFIEQQKLFQFLSGLNDDYSNETTPPIPSFSSDSASFNTFTSLHGRGPSQRVHSDDRRGFLYSSPSDPKRGYLPSSGPYLSGAKRFSTSILLPSLSCKYCKKSGHTIDKCYKLHGHPPDFKFTKGKKALACVQNDFSLVDATVSSLSLTEVPAAIDSGYAHFVGVSTHPAVTATAFHACAVAFLRRDPCVLLGYPCGKKGYKLLNLSSLFIFYSKDVVFHEFIFPFSSSSVSQPFSYSPPVYDDPLVLSTQSPSVVHDDPPIVPETTFSSLSSPPVVHNDSPAVPETTLSLPLRRSSRVVHPLHHLQGYICSSVKIPLQVNSKISSIDLHLHEPQFYQQAASNPAWQEAMQQEFRALGQIILGILFPFLLIRRLFLVSECTRLSRDLMLDVNNAFLNGDLHEDVFMKIPPGLQITSLGYIVSKNDYSLFTKSSGSSLVILVVYVDDILLGGSDLSELNALKSFLDESFKVKDLGSVHYFLGLEVTSHHSGFLINQHKYATDLLEEFNCSHYTPIIAPLDAYVKLTPDMGDPLPDPFIYRRLVGKLNFLQHTRPVISFAVQHLSQFLQHPCVPHMMAGLHVLHYLLHDPAQGIFLPSHSSVDLTAYADSGWAACPLSRRSVTGYYIFFGGCPVSWKNKKQPTIALSSAEAEYRALRKVVAEVIWLTRLFADMGLTISSPVPIFCDSQAALLIPRI
ncbi:uncharacterized protein LOC124898714 [Capsicum annuum]|uniref:uncharacterized protein LOC124898714 n=1 Tax=Capsicum annuum TaxID=4072 RepID=UPI001FB0AC8E|nr:uncharacterized protein LOC124898714 [Capsicum annuum]